MSLCYRVGYPPCMRRKIVYSLEDFLFVSFFYLLHAWCTLHLIPWSIKQSGEPSAQGTTDSRAKKNHITHTSTHQRLGSPSLSLEPLVTSTTNSRARATPATRHIERRDLLAQTNIHPLCQLCMPSGPKCVEINLLISLSRAPLYTPIEFQLGFGAKAKKNVCRWFSSPNHQTKLEKCIRYASSMISTRVTVILNRPITKSSCDSTWLGQPPSWLGQYVLHFMCPCLLIGLAIAIILVAAWEHLSNHFLKVYFAIIKEKTSPIDSVNNFSNLETLPTTLFALYFWIAYLTSHLL